ncbi:MAG: hypothetical protein K9H25_17605 [Rhodospirillum sp.]|nr:hypothetical protein [Rhodospirillum sp.]MCF8490354.1 hypothetical protein [Rhodospirillum sp.]MCF8501983.1 hypothetical protein [Rhodospirillum sp.]
MSGCKQRQTHYHTHWHNGWAKGCPGPKGAFREGRPGLIRRVTQFAADKTGLPRKGILALLIVGVIMNFPLAALIFIGVWLWSEHPDSVRRSVDRASATVRETFSGPRPAPATGPGPGADNVKPRPVDPDSEFADLRRAFDDLEHRASSMERHVTSEEYALNQKFKDMAREGKEQ